MKLLAIGFSFVAFVVAFFSLAWAWAILAFPELFLIWTRFTQTWPSYKAVYKDVPDLSPPADALFRKFRHYYYMPFANSSFSGAANALIGGSIALLVIGCVQGFWWGLAIAIPNAFVLANLAAGFDPRVSLKEDQIDAHNEVVARMFPESKKDA